MTTIASCAIPPARPSSFRAILGWVLFEWATQPFFTLLTTFVYAPYFATGIVADPARGQALWAFAASGAGLAVAALSPSLGAIADANGRRKPWIAGFGALLVIGSAALWFGRPQQPSSVGLVLCAYALGAVGAQCSLVFTNAMMPTLVSPDRVGRLSGAGWAIGYLGGLVSLGLTLGWLAANPQTGKTLLGASPLLGLDPILRQGDRATGPLTALWFIAFALPLFALTPDPPPQRTVRAAVHHGVKTLAHTLRQLPQERALSLFLVANMIYADGLVALFAFGGIYAAGTFHWTTIDIGIFGILLALAGVVGAFLGGMLDDRFGSRAVILGCLSILIGAAIGILSIDRDHVGFVIAVKPPDVGGSRYASTAERGYLALGLLIGAVAGPLQSASRSLLTRLAPRDRVTQFFGLFALSGRLTAFVGPFLVGVVTAATASQRAGMAVLLAFFLAGLGLMAQVRAPARASRDDGPHDAVLHPSAQPSSPPGSPEAQGR
jgi:MFS transporter, UMF1 family